MCPLATQDTEPESTHAEARAKHTAAEALATARVESAIAAQALVTAMQALKDGEAAIAAASLPVARAQQNLVLAAIAARAFMAEHFPSEGAHLALCIVLSSPTLMFP
jgi:hypothetical protein